MCGARKDPLRGVLSWFGTGVLWVLMVVGEADGFYLSVNRYPEIFRDLGR